MRNVPRVGIVVGSDSDLPLVREAAVTLAQLGIEHEVVLASAHRTPDRATAYARSAADRGVGVIIAAAGMAAHLPGVLAAHTTLPVIGLPVAVGALGGRDALYSMVQMPPGVPVATVGIGVGTMVLPRLTGLVQSHWGWRGAFQFLGYVAFALAVPAAVLLRGGTPGECEGEEPGAGEEGPCDGAGAPGGLTLREALRTSSFWLLFWGFVLIVVALYGVQFHQVPYATDRGVDREWALWSVTLFGATSILGRFFFGWLSDRTREKKAALYPSVAFLFLGLLVLMLVRNVWSLMLFAAVFGFGFAAYGPVIPAVCAEVFGKANMGAIFGAVTTGGALGGAAGPYLTGFIFDHAGSYTGAWVMAMACVALSALLFARVRVLWREPE